MTRPSDQAIATAKAALAKCAANDPWFPHPNEATILAWAEHIARHNLELDDILDGVTAAYAANGPGFRPLPADIIGAARSIRRERAERENAEQQRAEIDGKVAAIAAEAAAKKAIPDANPDEEFKQRRPERNPHDPRRVPCPYPPCRAGVGQPCIASSTHRPMRLGQRYHPSRIEAAAASPPQPPEPAEEDAAWPTCTACGTNPLVSDEDAARGVCTPCQQASTPQQAETEVPERNKA